MVELTEEVKREIGQHFVFGFHGYTASDDIKTLIRDYYLGNVILMKRNVQNIEQVHALTRELQQIAKDAGHERPLMIGTDQENGLVSAFSSSESGTQFPGAMALAASGSPALAEEISAASGKEMRLAGINWVYSPVADVNSDPRNPVIGVRSFGDDPQEVARYAKAVSRGITSAGLAPSAKHFPGHGNTHIDSHLSLPRILVDKAGLAQTELVPFKELIDNDVASIMTGHMALPLVTNDDVPCSLSKVITTDLLRGELGFQGVVVTDCLEMDAVAQSYGSEGGAVLSLQAGADVVMICHRYDRHVGALKATYVAVQQDILSLDMLRASRARINAMKEAFAGSWDEVLTTSFHRDHVSALKREHELLSRRAYAATIAKIRDPHGVLPLSKTGSAVLFTPRMESINLAVDDAEGKLRDKEGRLRNTAGPSYEAFAGSVARALGSPVQHVVYAPGDELPADLPPTVRNAQSVIFATRNGYERGVWQVEFLYKVLKIADARKMVLVTTCAPYDILYWEDIDVPCIATFEFTVPALSAATAVIYGEAEAQGTVPVRSGASAVGNQ
ncbi:glycoside hydrolase [Obba rivulosa]|uniref:Glycoside hydrolase n=1 Tax=Obba rivulosa TaxID=1052685 RepID=A0A8E2AVW8_9APHY|nr:glycoside hydrolase [Obba rivulosa]